ncbi:MAG: DUF3641 domain-containing protein [Verrucomicrobiota bacterium]|nr:DUF3641 domain-containing protein [Verrucomicrobiota bacterium]
MASRARHCRFVGDYTALRRVICGSKLPPTQAELEAAYKRELRKRYSIEFTGLFTITNQPIARFAENLRQHGNQTAAILPRSKPETCAWRCGISIGIGKRHEQKTNVNLGFGQLSVCLCT